MSNVLTGLPSKAFHAGAPAEDAVIVRACVVAASADGATSTAASIRTATAPRAARPAGKRARAGVIRAHPAARACPAPATRGTLAQRDPPVASSSLNGFLHYAIGGTNPRRTS